MARTVLYHLTHISTGTLANCASAAVVRSGRVIGVKISGGGVGGAGVGYLSVTAEHNNISQANGDTNNPPRETVLAHKCIQFGNGTVTANILSGNSEYTPMSVPVKIGDTLSVSQVQTGTAPGSTKMYCDFYVAED